MRGNGAECSAYFYFYLKGTCLGGRSGWHGGNCGLQRSVKCCDGRGVAALLGQCGGGFQRLQHLLQIRRSCLRLQQQQ